MKSHYQIIGGRKKEKKNNIKKFFFISYYYKKPNKLVQKNLRMNWFPKIHFYTNHQLFNFFLEPRSKLKNVFLHKRSKNCSRIIENLNIKNYLFKTVFLQFQEFYSQSFLKGKYGIYANSLTNLKFYVLEKKILIKILKNWIYLIENKNKKYQIFLTKYKKKRTKVDLNFEKGPEMYYFYKKDLSDIEQKYSLFNSGVKIEKTLSNQWVTFKKNAKFKGVIFQLDYIVNSKRLFFLFKKTKLDLAVLRVKSIINIANQITRFTNSKFI